MNELIFLEKEVLKQYSEKYPYKFLNEKILQFELNFHNKLVIIMGTLEIPKNYPIIQPKIKFQILKLNERYSIDEIEFEKFLEVNYYLSFNWTTNSNIIEIIFDLENYFSKKITPKSTILTILKHFEKRKLRKTIIFIILSFSIFLRYFVALGDYSGFNNPPEYGDYEAQRHWQEITINIPAKEWYSPGPLNDLTYWRIDYPPLSAYHAYLFGFIAKKINPNFVKPFDSRGIKSKEHKFFMRNSVIISDIIFFISIFLLIFWKSFEKIDFTLRCSFLIIILICPGLILIDHGHFQYNSVMFAFTVIAFILCSKNKIFVGSIFFVLAVNFKQMGLYYSIPFFAYILGKILILSGFFKVEEIKVD